MTATNTFGRVNVVPLTNKSGGSVAAGDVVYLSDGSTSDSFTTGTTANYTKGIGIAQQTIANNGVGLVLISGYAALVNVNASVTILHFGATHTVAKQATDAGATRAAGTFCIFLTGGTTPDAIIWQPDLGGGSGMTNPMTTTGDLITSSSGSTPDRIAAVAAGQVLKSAGTSTEPAWGYAPFHGCKAYYSTTQAITSTVTTGLIYDTEEYDTDAFHFTSAANLTGTVAKTSGSANIVGSGTSFTTELSVNQVISIPGTAAEIGVVKIITDNTNLTLWQTMANSASGQTATRKNDYLAIPAGLTGKYSLKAGGFWSTAPTTGFMGFTVNGSTIRGHRSNASANYMQVTTDAILTAGDYIQVIVNESSGNYNFGHASAVDAQSFCAIALLGV